MSRFIKIEEKEQDLPNRGIKTSNQLYNVNSFEYLQYLVQSIDEENIPVELLSLFKKAVKATKRFKENFCYGDLYTTVWEALTNYVELKPKDNRINNLVIRLYINRNLASERTYMLIQSIIKSCAGNSARIASAISTALPESESDEKAINEITPLTRESTKERLLDSFIREDFKPQHLTSLLSVRNYRYKQKSDPIELRSGTQAERHGRKPRVSPLFKKFIEIQRQDNPNAGITHVYFNALGRDALPFSFGAFFKGIERSSESAFSSELEKLEDTHTNVAVITLPADKGIMAHSYVKDQTIVKNPFDKLLDIACNRSQEPVKDFYISDSIRIKLFGNHNQDDQLEDLLFKSFEDLGFLGKEELTRAEFQAVWFYFTKYTLTNFIIEKLNPLTFQMSCKDGIDRAGVHSAFYNLMKSFEPGRKPMSLEEFEQAIDAAATMVKGRGMNDHRDRLWNVINFYVRANYGRLENDENKSWLLRWHANNCPAGAPFRQ